MLTWLPQLIYAQFIAVIALSIGTLFLLMSRKNNAKKRLVLSDHYQDLLNTEMMDTSFSPAVFARWKALNLDRDIFHEVILNQMKMVVGTEREFLIRLYEETDFKQADLTNCKSVFWETRLNAVIHLGALESPELAPLFYKMIPDPDPLVAIAALLSLSRLKHPLNNPELISQIPESILTRSNALYELIANIGLRHGVATLLQVIRTDGRTRVVASCLRALRNTRSFEATEALNDLLRNPGMLSPNALREIIETLTLVSDPSSVTVVRPYLNHSVPSVRAKAALLLMVFQDPESIDQIAIMRQDPDVEIKRIFQIYISMQNGVMNDR